MFGDRNYLPHCFDFLAEKSEDLEPHTNYLVIDSNSRSLLPRNLIVRSNIFPNENGKTNPIFFMC